MRGSRQRQRKLGRARGIEHQAQILDEDVDGGQRRVVARQHVGHATQGHGFGGGGDVHAGQQLVDDLDLAARARLVAQAIDLAGHGVEHMARRRICLGRGRGHHRHLARGSLGRPAGDGAIHIQNALLRETRLQRNRPVRVDRGTHDERAARSHGGRCTGLSEQHSFGHAAFLGEIRRGTVARVAGMHGIAVIAQGLGNAQAHGAEPDHADLPCVAVADRLDHRAMLVADLAGEVFAARLVAARHANRFLQVLAEEAKRLHEERIAAGRRDGLVKAQVFGHAVTAGRHGSVNAVECGVDLDHLGIGATLGSQRGAFGLQRAAQFDDVQHGVDGAGLRRVDPQRLEAGLLRDVHAAALARFDHAFVAQPRDGLADHGTADAEFLPEHGFGRHAFAAAQFARVDLGHQGLGHAVGQGGRGVESFKHGAGMSWQA
ncbi:hypothetical protein COLO4_01989 [Corchorus olitorius]|uniref:Uncharacterized protein n=1 Tax=Corchorus olitorius TaxID=93759 RepID=A0A1R3L1P6_9ROSI|nr:hypothetical protein COLO4_01989 [Corchorus olitorius]